MRCVIQDPHDVYLNNGIYNQTIFFILLSTSQSAGAMTKVVKPPLPVEVGFDLYY